MGEAYDRRVADWRVIDPARRRSVLAGARPDIAPANHDVLRKRGPPDDPGRGYTESDAFTFLFTFSLSLINNLLIIKNLPQTGIESRFFYSTMRVPRMRRQ